MKRVFLSIILTGVALGQTAQQQKKAAPAKPQTATPTQRTGNCSPALSGVQSQGDVRIVFEKGACPGVDTARLEQQFNALFKEIRGDQQTMLKILQSFQQGAAATRQMSGPEMQKVYEDYVKQLMAVYKSMGVGVAGGASTLKDIPIRATPHQDDTILLQPAGQFGSAKLQYSTDGTNFTDLAYSQIVKFGPGTKLFVRVVDASGTEILRQDKSAEIARQLVELVKTSVKQMNVPQQANIGTPWGCSLVGCKFIEWQQKAICSPLVTKAYLSDDNTKFSFAIDRSRCNLPVEKLPGACHYMPQFPFPLRVGKPVYLKLEFSGGGSLVETLEVSDYILAESQVAYANPHLKQIKNWALLEPVNPVANRPSPIAAAAFSSDSTYWGVHIFSGMQGCERTQESMAAESWLLDQDGYGLERLKHPGPVLPFGPGVDRPPSLKQATELLARPLKIGVAFESSQRTRSSTYEYTLDLRKVIMAEVARHKPAKVRCDGRAGRSFECGAADPIAWIGMKGLRYGPKPTELNRNIDLDYTPEHYLAADYSGDLPEWARYQRGARAVFIFRPEPEWSDIFYQVIYEDGKLGDVERARVPR